jgi:hypothetical protein
MVAPPFRAHVRWGNGGSRVIAVFEPLLPGEKLVGLEKWVIRDVKVRLEDVDGVETQCEVWVDRVDDE